VPFFCIEKRAIAMIAAITIRVLWLIVSNPGIIRIPSTALNILMAGVITPSPKRKEIPTI
jgi:hypothetical protein